jgi:hypothetical protein
VAQYLHYYDVVAQITRSLKELNTMAKQVIRRGSMVQFNVGRGTFKGVVAYRFADGYLMIDRTDGTEIVRHTSKVTKVQKEQ